MLDLSVNDPFPDDGPSTPPGQVPQDPPDEEEDTIVLQRSSGRSYGLELLIRRESTTGVFGWLSYTLSRSERNIDGRLRAFDFDRTHVLNLVAGIRLPRSWQLGLRTAYFSGRAHHDEPRGQHGSNRGLVSH